MQVDSTATATLANATSLNREWWRTAIIYEMSIRSFADGNGDGIGDFVGANLRLDYIQSLGVDCLWLLPVNPSPLRDGGYDVADYYEIHPDLGTLDDARAFINAAHQRGIRVIMDLVINHTSDQHPWFQEARSSLHSPKRDWYMWSDTKDKYQDAKICFPSISSSNWEWDDQAQAYYWHRFFTHQPDLNFDCPEVHEAILDVVRFWLRLGFDGFRLDAIPHLYAREGTSCDSLPETHAFLAKLRATIDREFDGDRLLLAEANGWPTEVVEYLGNDTRPECHMCFNFPIMPRIYIAVRRGSNEPLVDALQQIPPTPRGGQWGIFLRNHDHIDLSTVPDDDRAFMLDLYAPEPAMQINGGIRRRLAPMLNGDVQTIMLVHSLLFTMAGTPVMYYGDEIGMGDDTSLDDRDGLRTPMQWDATANAGFSAAPADRIYPPVIRTGQYGYTSVNVADEQRDMDSLWNRVRTLIAVCSAHPVFGMGAFDVVDCTNAAVFAFLRSSDEETVLCIHNLSATSQTARLNLARFFGEAPIDLLSAASLSPVEVIPYDVTLEARQFRWLQIS